jgi:predicted unusual protein kinase regulating ubiquinone biosynthesis (AarF/ABC1/UbiB family)
VKVGLVSVGRRRKLRLGTRKHRIYGSPHFTLPILSLLTYKGIIKDIYPELDFQQEAAPFIAGEVALSV